MPVQKKITTYMTKSSKKGKSTGSRFRRRTLRKFSGQRVFKIRRTARLGTIVVQPTGYQDVSGNALTPWFTQFTLDNLPSRTEITNLFGEYRIKGLKFRISPRFDSADVANLGGATPNSGGGVKWYVVKDKDTSVDSATEDAMMQQHVRMYKGNRDLVLYCAYPKYRLNVANQASTSVIGYTATNKWLTNNDFDVQHCSYAIGVYSPNTAVGPALNYDVWVTAYVHCKSLR